MRINSHDHSKLTKHQHQMRARLFIKDLEKKGMVLNEASRKIVSDRVAFGKGVGRRRFGHAQRKLAEAEYREVQARYLKGKKVGYQCWQPYVDRAAG